MLKAKLLANKGIKRKKLCAYVVKVQLRLIMGISKTEEFTIKQNKIASYAKALAHPARVAILEVLLKRASCVCGDIVEELPLSQSTVSQHLKELKEAGLIKGEIEGTKVCYCIDEKEWDNAKNYLGNLFDLFVNKKNCC